MEHGLRRYSGFGEELVDVGQDAQVVGPEG
jgi:hypothetical protein